MDLRLLKLKTALKSSKWTVPIPSWCQRCKISQVLGIIRTSIIGRRTQGTRRWSPHLFKKVCTKIKQSLRSPTSQKLIALYQTYRVKVSKGKGRYCQSILGLFPIKNSWCRDTVQVLSPVHQLQSKTTLRLINMLTPDNLTNCQRSS